MFETANALQVCAGFAPPSPLASLGVLPPQAGEGKSLSLSRPKDGGGGRGRKPRSEAVGRSRRPRSEGELMCSTSDAPARSHTSSPSAFVLYEHFGTSPTSWERKWGRREEQLLRGRAGGVVVDQLWRLTGARWAGWVSFELVHGDVVIEGAVAQQSSAQ